MIASTKSLNTAMILRLSFCIALFISINCIGAMAQQSEPVKGGDIRIHSLSEPENLNPLTSTDAGASYIDGLIYESLTTTDWETGTTIPVLADSLPVLTSRSAGMRNSLTAILSPPMISSSI
jgi:ABC-type transport system substrate-binding protein